MQDGCERRCGSDGVVDRGPTCALSCADGNSVATGRRRVSGRPSISSCMKLLWLATFLDGYVGCTLLEVRVERGRAKSWGREC